MKLISKQAMAIEWGVGQGLIIPTGLVTKPSLARPTNSMLGRNRISNLYFLSKYPYTNIQHRQLSTMIDNKQQEKSTTYDFPPSFSLLSTTLQRQPFSLYCPQTPYYSGSGWGCRNKDVVGKMFKRNII